MSKTKKFKQHYKAPFPNDLPKPQPMPEAPKAPKSPEEKMRIIDLGGMFGGLSTGGKK
jgi:hypothetical protein